MYIPCVRRSYCSLYVDTVYRKDQWEHLVLSHCRLHHQKSRYVYDLFYKRKAISRGGFIRVKEMGLRYISRGGFMRLRRWG